MLREFREFAVKGNVADLAVGLIVGAAFGKIVTSLVNDLLMPPLGLLVGKLTFANLFVPLGSGSFATVAEAKAAGVPVLAYGAFLATVLDFVLVAFAVFLVVKQMNRLRRPKAPPAPVRTCPFCLEPVATAATRCRHCAAEIGAAPAASRVQGG